MTWRFIAFTDEDYPPLLREAQDAPTGLYLWGKFPKDWTLTVAIVGTREASGYGKQTAEEFGIAVGNQGITVVTGLAHGIDAHATKGAFQSKTPPLLVAPSGFARFSYRTRKIVQAVIAKGGGVVSEYSPDTEAAKWRFLARNRIVAGMSKAALAIECRAGRSGTLNTIRLANDYSRMAGAIPGSINAPASAGCHDLIKNNLAHLVSNVNDVRHLLGLQATKTDLPSHPDAGTETLLRHLFQTPSNEQALVETFKNTLTDVPSRLSALELDGLVENKYGVWYCGATYAASHR